MGERFSFKNDFYFGWYIDRFWMLCYSKDDNINVQTILIYIFVSIYISLKCMSFFKSPKHFFDHISYLMHELILLRVVCICMCVYERERKRERESVCVCLRVIDIDKEK